MNHHPINHDTREHGHDDAQSQAHVRATKLPSFRACLEGSAMSEEGFIGALLQTSLSRLDAWTLPDLERLLAACLRYNLSQTGREIFLVPDHAAGAPLLVVGVDGWSRMLNEHKQFAGMKFKESIELIDGIPAWIQCTIHRRDRRVATAVREYLCEVRGTSSAWITHPRRGSTNHRNYPPANRRPHTNAAPDEPPTIKARANKCQRTKAHAWPVAIKLQNGLILIWHSKPPQEKLSSHA